MKLKAAYAKQEPVDKRSQKLSEGEDRVEESTTDFAELRAPLTPPLPL